MGMSIDEAENYLIALKHCETCEATDTNICKSCPDYRRGSSAKCYDAIDVAKDTMRKYQQLQADYENRLKADMVAMLTEIQLEIEELKNAPACCHHFVRGICRSSEVIQQKIDALKADGSEMVKE